MQVSFSLSDSLYVSRTWILGIGLLAGIAAGLGSYLIDPTYRAHTVFFINTGEDSGPLAQLTRQVSVGALAGFLGGGMRGERRNEALAVLKSREFAAQFITERNMLPVLFPKQWDALRGDWKVSGEERPTMADAFRIFDRKIRAIAEDRVTGSITLSIEWKDPELAARWTNEMVAEADAFLRRLEIEEAERSIDYLKQEVAKATVVELQRAIYGLTEEQIKRAMLARVREDFAFKVVDPAVAPDRDDRASPKRAAIAIGGMLLGTLLAAFGAVLLDVRRRARAAHAAAASA